jgi:lycopene beta-cyclase
VAQLAPTGLVLADGSRIEARCVIDGRGWGSPPGIDVGYQCFVGFEVSLAEPHGLLRPMIMDATVAQAGGYRFMYAVPLGPDLLLLEDTAYADRPEMPLEESRRAIDRYATSRGWTIREVVRTEHGALPIPLTGALEALTAQWVPGVPTVGVRAGLFHATTGYSLPNAVQVAELIATADRLDSASLAPALAHLTKTVWRRQRFFRLLNRMLFFAAAPDERYRVLQRFYGLSEGLIERFYADRLTAWDRLRLVTGRPPVPFFRGLACLPERIPTSSR